MIRVLILSRDLRSRGGVVNVTNTLSSNFSKNITSDRFIIGRRRAKSGIFKRILQSFADARRLAFTIKKSRYDLIQLNPSIRPFSLLRDGLFVVIIHILGFKKIIIFFHGWNSIILRRISNNCILRQLFLRIFGNAGAIIVLAKQFKKELIDVGVSNDKIHVTTTMFSKDIFKGVTPGIPRNQFQLLFLSRIIRDKGIYELVDAFERIRNQFPNLKMTIAGDGPEMTALSRYINEKNFGDSVSFTGYIRNRAKAKVFLDSDIYILPTYSEGCPVSMLEAMAAGLAVIASPVGGIADIIDDDVNGILLKHPTPSHIATALKRLLSDRKFCETIQDNNRHKAWENYEAKIVTGTIEAIYAQVAGHV